MFWGWRFSSSSSGLRLEDSASFHPRVLAGIAAIALAYAWAAAARVDPISASLDAHSWVYPAIERLKTLGVMPLWAGVVRPISDDDLKTAVGIATERTAGRSLAPADLVLLQRLQDEVGGADLRHSADISAGPVEFGLMRPAVSLAGGSGSSAWRIGWTADTVSSASLAWHGGDVSWLAGREVTGWGPLGTGGQLFSENAGGFDRIQFSLAYRTLRFTKLVGWLDGDRSIVGTRIDILSRPNLRIGFSESIIITGGPYWPYIVDPVPFIINEYLEQQLRPASGDNQLNTIDAEWVVRPGLRLYGELLIDDLTVPTPTADFPSRWGASVGGQMIEANGGSLELSYGLVTNWTYTDSDPTSNNYLLRGVPLAQPLGDDFDIIHIRWAPSPDPGRVAFWGSAVRKGEGRIGVIWTSQNEAWQDLFLSGVVEYSTILGLDVPFGSGDGWTGTVGPWVAFRTNAGHIAGATRTDVGITLTAQWSF